MYIKEIGVNVYRNSTMGYSLVKVLSYAVETAKINVKQIHDNSQIRGGPSNHSTMLTKHLGHW